MRRGAGARGSSWSRQSTPGSAPARRAAALALLLGACGGNALGTAEAGAGDVAAPGPDAAVAVVADSAAPDGPSALDAPPAPDLSPDTPAPSPDLAAPDAPLPDAGVPLDTAPSDRPPKVAVRDLDLLFLIDNSPSMMEEQSNLRRNFAAFIEELKKVPGGMPNLHIGIVSSDLGAGSQPLSNGGCPRPGGDRGILQVKPNCGLDPSSRFMVSLNNGTNNNFAGPMESVFSCLANLGTAGCGYEHQLQATRVALYEAVTPENKGFLRSEALLAIIIVSDEDDCSAETNSNLFVDDASFPQTAASFRCSQVGHVCNGVTPPIAPLDVPLESCQANPGGRLIKVSEVVDSIRALKRVPAEQIMVAGIFGWPNTPGARYRYVQTASGVDVAPICQSVNGEAAPGLRLKQFVESFGALGSFYSICQDDWSPALRTIGQAVATRF